MIDLNQFAAWQAAAPEDRVVRISLEGSPGALNPWVYVYSYRKALSQHVISVEEIDFDAAHKKEERAEYERLKKIYGEEDEKECQR